MNINMSQIDLDTKSLLTSGKSVAFSFSDWLIALSIMFSRSIHAVTKGETFFFLRPRSIPLCKQLFYPLIYLWTLGLFLYPFELLVGMQTGAATVGSSMEKPHEIKNRSAFDPVIPLLRIYLKEPKTLTQKNISTPMFISALFTIAKI